MSEPAPAADSPAAQPSAPAAAPWARLGAGGSAPAAVAAAGALLYLAAALLCITLSRQPGSVATIWYANAVGTATLSALSWRQWPLSLALLAGAIWAANVLAGDSGGLALAFVAGNLLEMALAACLLQRAGLAGSRLQGPRPMSSLLLLAGVVAPAAGAVVGAAALAAHGLGTFGALWLPWFEGGVIGALSLLPLAFLFAQQGGPSVLRSLLDARLLIFLPAVVGIALLILVHLPFPFVFLLLPLLLAAMVLPTAALSLMTLATSLTVATALACGVFAMPPLRAEWEQLLVYGAYAAALLPGLLLVATMEGLRESRAELEAAALRLRRAHEGLRQFVHIASHDLREPLNTVAQFGGLLQAEEAERLSPSGGRYLRLMIGGTVRMRTMLDDVLAFARVEHGEAVPATRVDLDRVFDELRDVLRHRIDSSGARLDIAQPLPAVQGHAVMLLLLFQNLLANGLKFVAAGTAPHVQVRAWQRGEQVFVEVLDHGIGVEPAQQARLFEPFRRLHLQREYEGSGLGLATARQIARSFGGDITLDSALGAGARFTVVLPAAD